MLCTHFLLLTACGPAPTVNLDCSDKGKASIGWQNDCDQDNCGMILSCTDSTGSTHNTKVGINILQYNSGQIMCGTFRVCKIDLCYVVTDV